MIILEEFIDSIYPDENGTFPAVRIYEGKESFNPLSKGENLICMHNSIFKAKISLENCLLHREVYSIHYLNDGIAICVSKEDCVK